MEHISPRYPKSTALLPSLAIPPQLYVPKLDAVRDLEEVRQTVAAHSKLKNHARIQEVAHPLVASTFFFKYVSTTMEKDGKWKCDGKLAPRPSFVSPTKTTLRSRLNMLPLLQWL